MHSPIGGRGLARRIVRFVAIASLLASAIAIDADRVQAVTGGLAVDQAGFESQWPFAVAVYRDLGDGRGPRYICTGTLIAPAAVMTARHCSSATSVAVGATDRNVARRIDVASVAGAPDEKVDIAVLHLAARVPATPLPIASLDDLATLAPPFAADFAGWGVDDSGSNSTILRDATAASVVHLPSNRFQGAFWNFEGLPSACDGDSGGPLVAMFGGVRKLIGAAALAHPDCRSDSLANSLYSDVGDVADFLATEKDFPSPVLAVAPATGSAPLDVSFDLSGSFDVDGNASGIVSYSLSPGDGRFAVDQTNPVITHTYTAPGSFTARVCVTDAVGRRSCGLRDLVVAGDGAAPQVSATVRPRRGPAPLVVNVDASASTDEDGLIVGYGFDPGDGSGEQPTGGPVFDHVYSEPGTYFALVTATDDSGYTSVRSLLGIVVEVPAGDLTPPEVVVPGDVFSLPTDAFGASVEFDLSYAVDDLDGEVPVNCDANPGDMFPFGATFVTCTASDSAGNEANAGFVVSVGTFQFEGFLAPIDNPLVVNTVRAGATVPLKWRLTGQGGIPIGSLETVIAGWPTQTRVPCSETGGTEDPVPATTAGAAGLAYDPVAEQFVFVWKTPKRPGTCWIVQIALTDGTSDDAWFKLR